MGNHYFSFKRRVSGQRHLWLSRGRDRRTGRRVLLSRSGRWRPSLASFRECYTYSYMVSEMLAFEPKTQVKFLIFPHC